MSKKAFSEIEKKKAKTKKKKTTKTQMSQTQREMMDSCQFPKTYLMMLLCPNVALMIRVTAYSEKTGLFTP